MASYVAEFVGTFMLVFTVGCAAVTNKEWAVPAIAAMLMVMVYAFGPVSGANFNPAVSLTLGLSKKLDWQQVLMYWGAQLLAAVCAGLAFSFMLKDGIRLAPGEGFNVGLAASAEAIYTSMLCFVVCNVAYSKSSKPNEYFALAIGSVILAGGYAAGGISGACLNPAVTLGLLASDFSFSALMNASVWCIAQCVGACLAVTLFRLVRPDEFGNHEGALAIKAVAEFYGTFMLAVTVGLNLACNSPATAVSAAACLLCMIYSLGNVSGGHFNPAVTLGVMARGGNKCDMMQWGVYTVVQAGAGMIAGDVVGMFHRHSEHTHSIMLAPGQHGFYPALATEFLFTAVLVFVVLAVATVQDANSSNSFGLAIAACVLAGGVAAGSISGAALNPAVAFAMSSDSVAAGEEATVKYFTYWALAEMAGAVFATALFFVTWRSEYSKEDYSAVRQDNDMREDLLAEPENGGFAASSEANNSKTEADSQPGPGAPTISAAAASAAAASAVVADIEQPSPKEADEAVASS